MRIDAHWDTALYLREQASLLDLPWAHADYKRLCQYLDLAFFALFIHPEDFAGREQQEMDHLLHLLKRDIAAQNGLLEIALNARQLESGRKLALIGAEGGGFLGHDAGLLDMYFLHGLRFLSLTWNYDNALAGGCNGDGGLTKLGKDVAQRANSLGLLLDGAHLSERSLKQLLSCSRQPIIVSHMACAALFGHTRNLSDEYIKEVAATGGVVGICFCRHFLGANDSISRVADHIEHAVSVAGINHVGIGSDFDGTDLPPDIAGLQHLPLLWQELRQRGFSEQDLSKIEGENFRRVLEKVLPY